MRTGRVRGDLGGDHRPERVPDQYWLLELQGIQHVVVVQRQVMDVVQVVELRQVGEAGRERGRYRVVPRERLDERSVASDTVQAVQIDQGWAATGSIHHLVATAIQANNVLGQHHDTLMRARSSSGSVVGAWQT